MRNKAGVALIPLMVAAAFAQAEGTVGDLSRIQSETIILKAKVSRATAQSELDAKSRVGQVNDDVDAPVVKSVYGVGRKLFASFLYSNGVAMDAKQGDTILGGYKVVTLTVDKVELGKGKRRFVVGFSATAPTPAPQSATQNGAMFGQPYMPPIAPPVAVKP